MTLVGFLLARIAEDEYALSEENIGPGHHDFDDELGLVADDWGVSILNVPPKRFLAECKSKREIVEMYDEHDQTHDPRNGLAEDVLFILAAVYSGHPDYDQRWSEFRL